MNRRFHLSAIDDIVGQEGLSTELFDSTEIKKYQSWERLFLPSHPINQMQSNERDALLFLSIERGGRVPIAALRFQGEEGKSWEDLTSVRWRVPALRRSPGFLDVESIVYFLRKTLSGFDKKVKQCEGLLPSNEAFLDIDSRRPMISSEERIDRIAVLNRLGFSMVGFTNDDSSNLLKMRLERPSSLGWGELCPAKLSEIKGPEN
jgi:hypothetical protein